MPNWLTNSKKFLKLAVAGFSLTVLSPEKLSEQKEKSQNRGTINSSLRMGGKFIRTTWNRFIFEHCNSSRSTRTKEQGTCEDGREQIQLSSSHKRRRIVHIRQISHLKRIYWDRISRYLRKTATLPAN